jgi:hypothetical protein
MEDYDQMRRLGALADATGCPQYLSAARNKSIDTCEKAEEYYQLMQAGKPHSTAVFRILVEEARAAHTAYGVAKKKFEQENEGVY